MVENTNQSNTQLTEDDIRNLVKSDVDTRLDVTKKIATYYGMGGFGDGQRAVAEKIFRALLKDTEVEIRKTLSEAIKNSKDIPHDVVMELAKDVNEVSIPVLEFSEVLTDVDLIQIIESTEDITKQQGIGRRKTVSERVSDALVETRNESVVGTLLKNIGANVSDDSYKKIVKEFATKESLLEAMLQREKIPVSIIETITNTVSKELYNKLAAKHQGKLQHIDNAMGQSKEVATMKVMGMQTTEQEYYQFCQLMKKLHIADDLMPISALCVGNLNLFEVCLARITKVPVLNVRTLLSDPSNKGFKVLYERANLPSNLYEATEVLLEVMREHKDQLSGGGIKLSRKAANLMIGNITMRVEERGEVENIDYIVTLIRHNAEMSDSR